MANIDDFDWAALHAELDAILKEDPPTDADDEHRAEAVRFAMSHMPQLSASQAEVVRLREVLAEVSRRVDQIAEYCDERAPMRSFYAIKNTAEAIAQRARAALKGDDSD